MKIEKGEFLIDGGKYYQYPVVKVSRNAPERRSGAWKFKLGAFRLQNYLILQSERTFLGPAS